MKKTIWAIGVLSLLFAGERIGATASLIQNPTVFKISIALPQESLGLEDLDARDEFNRPIKTHAVRVSFMQLWARSLNQTILNSLTPLRLQMLALLNSKWDGFCGRLQRTTQTVLRTFKIWFEAKKSSLKVFIRVLASQRILPPVDSFAHSDSGAFLYFLSFVLSSTQLLR